MEKDTISSNIISLLLKNAYEKFDPTPIGERFKEKQQEILDECENNFTETQNHIMQDYFRHLTEVCEIKMEYLYIQGFKDCYSMLKELGLVKIGA